MFFNITFEVTVLRTPTTRTDVILIKFGDHFYSFFDNFLLASTLSGQSKHGESSFILLDFKSLENLPSFETGGKASWFDCPFELEAIRSCQKVVEK